MTGSGDFVMPNVFINSNSVLYLGIATTCKIDRRENASDASRGIGRSGNLKSRALVHQWLGFDPS